MSRGGAIHPHISSRWILEVKKKEPKIEDILYEIIPEIAYNPDEEIREIKEKFKKHLKDV